MVLLAGLGTALSMFIIYRNKNRIGFELIKYYTYLDEYFASKLTTVDTKMIYYDDNTSISETMSTNKLLICLNNQNNIFLTYDFLVKSLSESDTKIVKDIYSIFVINYSDDNNGNYNNNNNNNLDNQSIKYIDKIYGDIRLAQSYDIIEEHTFKNKILNFESTMDWKCPVIAASISIKDTDGVVDYREYDITSFFIGFSRPNKTMILDNSEQNKKIWILIFNYIFNNKNIFIQSEYIKKIEISWTIIMENCRIHTGNNLKIEY